MFLDEVSVMHMHTLHHIDAVIAFFAAYYISSSLLT